MLETMHPQGAEEMPTIRRAFLDAIRKEVSRKPCGRTDLTRRRYARILIKGMGALEAAGMLVLPHKIEPRTHGPILLKPFYRGRGFNGGPIYGEYEAGIWDRFLKRHGLDLVDELGLSWHKDHNRKRPFYSEDMMDRVISAIAPQPELMILVALAYYQAMRRVDMRALVDGQDRSLPGAPVGVDVDGMALNWRGKGQGAGKVRSLEMVEILPDIIREYRMWRLQELHEARKINPDAVMPERFLIARKGGRIRPIAQNTLDIRARQIESICTASGLKIHIEWHGLRASGATAFYNHIAEKIHPESAIKPVQAMLGHTSTETTRLYILRYGQETRESMKAWSDSLTARFNAQIRAEMQPAPPTVN